MTSWNTGVSPTRPRLHRIFAVALAFGLLAAACGNDDDGDDNGTAAPTTQAPSDNGDTGGNGDDVTVDFDPAWCGPLPETVRVEMAAGASTAYGSHWLAIANGWYEAENLQVEQAVLNRASDALPLLASGQLDAVAGGFGASTFNAIHEGLDLVGTISMGMYDPENPPGGIYVRNELIESGEVTDPTDLAGMRIGIDAPDGGSLRYIVSHWFREGGLDMDDVVWVEMPRDTIPQALVDGSVDFAYVPSSIAVLVQDDGASQLLGDPAWITNEGRDSLITLLFNDEALENNRDVARAMVRANLLARQDLVGNYIDDEDTVDKLADMINSDAAAITGVPPFMFVEDGEMYPETIMGMQDFFMGQGNLSYTEPMRYEDIFDDSLRLEALATIEHCD